MTEFNLKGTSSARLKKTTIYALKALIRPELDETLDDVVQRLITFYLKKPDESKKRMTKRKVQ